jgi:hypothetical protein
MKEHEHEGKDDFWSARHYLFTAKFPTYYTQPQKVWGRFHTSEEQYHASPDEEIIPIKEKKGKRTYVMMQPYVREPNLTLTIGLYDKPKQYADQEAQSVKCLDQDMKNSKRCEWATRKPGIIQPIKPLYFGSVFLITGL